MAPEPVIDRRTDARRFWLGAEKTSVTLTLVETGRDQSGIRYDARYSGVKSGHVAGGPIPVSGNGSWVVNQSPKVTVTVSNYSDDRAQQLVSMHIEINVDLLGTVFDQTMGGAC